MARVQGYKKYQVMTKDIIWNGNVTLGLSLN